jgi:hypothetical protein
MKDMKSLIQHINESSLEELKTRLIELINNSDNEIPLRRAYNIIQHISDELYDEISASCYSKWPLGLKEVFRIIEEYPCKRDFFEELKYKNTETSKFATLEDLKNGNNLFNVIKNHTEFDNKSFFGNNLKQFLQKLYDSRPNDINNATGKGELLLQTMFKNAKRGNGADIEIDGVGIEVKGNKARLKGNNKVLKDALEISNYVKRQLNIDSPIRIGGYKVLSTTFEDLFKEHNIDKETIFINFANMYFYQCSNFNTEQQDSFNNFIKNYKNSNNIEAMSFKNIAKILLDIHCALILISYYLSHKRGKGTGFEYLLVINPDLDYYLIDIEKKMTSYSTIESQVTYILENIINEQISVISGPDNGPSANEQNIVCSINVI